MEKSKVVKNAGWIIGIQIIKSVLGLVVSMLTARYLGPSNYGLINYASSLVSFVSPIMYLGLTGILVQEIIAYPEKEGEVLGTSITLSFFSSIICIVGIFGFVSIANKGESETIVVCCLYSVLLIFQAFEMMIYWFQAKLLSKYSSVVFLVAYILTSAYKIFLLATEKNVYWFAISNAFDYMIIAIGLFIIYKKLGGMKLRFSFETAKRLFSKSRYYIVSSMMVTIFTQTDRIMLKLMINDVETGFYSAAVTCASMTSFVFSAIIDSFRPLIFDSKKNDEEQYEKNICRLYNIIIYLSLLQCIIMSVFSGLIINILYGSEYASASKILSVLVWYTTFSYLGSVRNIWILAENKQKYLWIINFSGALLNIVLNYFLIPMWSGIGAAVASLITQVFTNIIIGFVIKPIVYNNKLMLKGCNPLLLKDMWKIIMAKKKKT